MASISASAWPTLTLETNQSLQMPAVDLAYSGYDGMVYLSIPANGGSLSNTLTAIAPMTGDVGASIPVGNDPGKLAVSDDGRFVYVVSGGGNRIDQVNLTTAAVSLSFTLGSTVSGPMKATDIAVMPGQSGTIAVACGDGIGQPEVRVYDGSTLRPQTLPGTWVTTLAFGAGFSVLYGFDSLTTDRGFYTMSVNTNGVSLVSNLDFSPFERGAGLAYAAGLVFSTSKGIFDPNTSQMQFPFYGSSGFAYYAPFAADAHAHRVCYALPKGSNFENLRFQVFNLDTYLPMGEISIPSPPGYFTGTLIRWAADGLAYRANTNQIIFLRTSYLPNGPAADLVVRQGLVPVGPSNALRCTVENQGSNSAQGTKLSIRFEGNVAFGAITTSAGNVATSSNQVVCDFGAQDASTTNTLTIQFAQTPSNTVVATASASSLNRDPNTGNNTSVLVISTPATTSTGSVFAFTLPIVDMVADPTRGGIYLAIDRQVPDLGNGIVYFDPTSGLISSSIFVGPNISKLAISADGQVLYAASAGQLTKLDTASLTTLTNIPLDQGYAASDLAAFPSDSDRVAVWHITQADRLGSVFSIGLGIYEDGSLLSATNIGPTGRFRQVSAAADGMARVFDSWNGLEVLRFGAANGTLTNDQDLPFPYLDYGGETKYQGDRFYAARGRVFDGSSQRVLGTFNIPGVDGWPNTSSGAPLVEPDIENGRVLFMRYDGTNVNLIAFDAQRYQIIGSVPVPGVSTTPSRLIRLGGGRVAFKTDKLFVVRTSLIPTGPEADLGVQLSGGANPGSQGVSESYSMIISNQGPESASGISGTVTFSTGGAVDSINPSQGAANFVNSILSWNVGSIAAGGSASLRWNFTVATAGILQVTASVSGQCRDRNPFNDTSAHLEVATSPGWPRQIARFSVPAKDVVATPDGGSLFLSLHERGGAIGNSVLKLEPESGRMVGPVFVGSGLDRLAVSSDGQKLYVGADGASAVMELDATTLQPISSFSISNGLSADNMVVVPGSSERLLAYRSGAGLSLFENGVEASNRLNNITTFVFNDLTGEAFGCDRGYSGVPLYRLAIDAGGVSVVQTYSSALQQSASDLKSANGLLYYDRGLVVSPTLASEAQRYPVAQFTAHVQPALDRHLIYFLTGASAGWAVRAFGDGVAQPAGLQMLAGVSGTPGRLVRWGSTGLAFTTSADQLFCLKDLFTSDAPAADVAIDSVTAPQIAITNTSLLYTFAVTNRSDSVAVSTVVTQTFGLSGTIQSVQASVGTTQIHGTEIDWTLGNLAGHGSAQISVQLLPTGAQTITNETRATAASYDPFPANNLVQVVTPVQALSTNALVRVMNLGASDLVYDPATQLLWANATNIAGSSVLLPIEPLAGVVGPGIDTYSEAGRLGVAGNGVTLYCLQASAAGLARVNCANGQVEQFTPVGLNPTFGFLTPLDLAIMPGSPFKVAVSYYSTSSSLSNFVGLVDNGILQPVLGTSSSRPNVIEFDSAGDQVYGFNNSSSAFQLSTFGITASGFVYVTNRSGLISGFNTDIKRGGTRLYDSIGQVIDPRAGTVVTNLPANMNATAVEPAPAEGRVYYATKLPYAIRALNITNFVATATNLVPGVTGDVRALVRWGTDGLAMQTASGQVIIVRSSVVPVKNQLYIKGVWRQDASLAVVFPSAFGHTYALEMRGDLSGGSAWSPVRSGIIGTGNDLTNFVALSSTNGFLRVRTQP